MAMTFAPTELSEASSRLSATSQILIVWSSPAEARLCAVGREGDRANAAAVGRPLAERFAVGHMPDAEAAIAAAAGKVSAVAGERDRSHVPTGASERLLERAGVGRIDPQFVFEADRGDRLAAGTKAGGEYCGVEIGDPAAFFAVGCIPDDDPAVIASGDKRCALGREADRADPIGVAAESVKEFAARNLPDTNQVVVARGGEQRAIAGQGGRGNDGARFVRRRRR